MNPLRIPDSYACPTQKFGYNRAHSSHRMTIMTAQSNALPCKHPQVRIVAREEDCEYVECQLCGEVFDSNEFRDMMIEETVLQKDEVS